MNTERRARGFAYVEVLIAALVLALCCVPAANAIKNGIDAGQATQSKTAELYCVRNLMETVLAESYTNLNAAAGTTNYDLVKDDKCAARTVIIERKLFNGAKLLDLPSVTSDEKRDTALLRVQVSMDGASYRFSTVVAP